MAYKKDCGFREKVSVCNFKAKDCKPDECDFFEIPFTSKGILKRSRIERKEVIRLTKKIRSMKKQHKHKTDKKKYAQVKADRKDKVLGMVKLSKAYMYCKRLRK